MPSYTFKDGTASKFWQVEQQGAELHIRWGRVGTAGQSQVKAFDDAAQATAAQAKLVAEQTQQGYVADGVDMADDADGAPVLPQGRAKAKVVISRAVFPDIIARLAEHFELVANQGDVLWTREQLIAKLQGAAGVFTTAGEVIDAELLAACPDLRICANMGVGYNNYDVAAMTARGVLATNAPGVLTETTADFGFALLMATARRVSEGERYLREGRWKRWRYDMFAGADVHGSTLGILGMGRIGQAIARRGAHGFGMRVIYHNRSQLPPELEAECQASYVSKADLLARADHLMLVLPYTPEAHHAIGAAELAQMKPTATLINIARGGIVDDTALAQALANRTIAAAGLDVFEGEPSVHPGLLAVPNVVLTPHIASASVPTRLAMATLAADNLIAYLTRGEALTPVNGEVLHN
jgi:gluconate 2-dehydrogenase